MEAKIQDIIVEGSSETEVLRGHLLQSSGKRLRPVLFFLVLESYNKKDLMHIDVAVSLELIHTASLLHDDVIDQAVVRRNNDATHVKWTNKISILTGDYFLSRAFKLITATRNWELVGIVSNLVQDMTEGEIEQSFACLETDNLEQQYLSWIGNKTASFFAGCCHAGSLLAGGNEEDQDKWYNFGYNFGMAYQLVDDYLDYTGKVNETGKPVLGDLKNGVITLPLLKTKDLLADSRDIRKESNLGIQETAQLVLDNKGHEYTFTKAQKYTKKASDILNTVCTDNRVKVEFKKLISDLISRCNG